MATVEEQVTGIVQPWRVEGEWLVGITDGTRVHLRKSLIRPNEIAPGVARLPKDEGHGTWTWADGVYEQRVAKFRRLGKTPPPGFGISERVGPPWWRRLTGRR